MDNRFFNAYGRLRKAAFEVIRRGEYNSNPYSLIADAFWCFLWYGMTPNEYLGWNVWRLSARERRKFYTARLQRHYEKRYNPREYSHFFDNKYDFNVKFKAFVNRDWVLTSQQSPDNISDFILRHKTVIVKPINLSSGRGVFLVNYDDCDRLFQELLNGEFLIEEFIKQHPKMSELNPSSVNSIRVYTLLKKDGIPVILSASIRVGGKDAIVDNYHAGGVGYPIDIETGIVYRPGTGIDGTEYIFHPSSNVKMVGFEIPMWKQLKQFVFDAMKVLPQARLLAWDVAILPNGFEMIEGNYNGDPGFMQAPSKEGKRLVLKSYL